MNLPIPAQIVAHLSIGLDESCGLNSLADKLGITRPELDGHVLLLRKNGLIVQVVVTTGVGIKLTVEGYKAFTRAVAGQVLA